MVGYFNSLNEALEVKARTMSVNEKITYAAEVMDLLSRCSPLTDLILRYNPFCDNFSPR